MPPLLPLRIIWEPSLFFLVLIIYSKDTGWVCLKEELKVCIHLSPVVAPFVLFLCSDSNSMKKDPNSSSETRSFHITILSQRVVLGVLDVFPVRHFSHTVWPSQSVSSVDVGSETGAASQFRLGPLLISNTSECDERRSLSSTYLRGSICIPNTDMIFGSRRSRRGS